MGWRELSESERLELLRRRQEGEELETLAGEVGAKVETLARRIRELAQAQRGDIEEEPARVSVMEEGNTLEVSVDNSDRILTLEQLLKAANVDTEVWAVERYTVNKWEAARKDVSKQLTFEDGVSNGYVSDSGGFNIEPLFQVKATLVRINPVPLKPVIKPITINLGKQRSNITQTRDGMKVALILPDTQFGFSRDVFKGTLKPFHDRRAIDAVVQLARFIKPDVSVFLGDINDMSGWSDKFIRLPEFYFTTQPALIEASWVISQVHAHSNETVVLDGNHDVRMENQIIKHLMEAYQLRSSDNLDAGPVMGIDNLLGLSRMGVSYIEGYPDGDYWLNDTTRIIHGTKVRGGPGQTASAVVKDADETTIFGHIHRHELASRTIRSRKGNHEVVAYSPGCLCHIDGRVPGSSRDNNWQQGAAIVWYDDEQSHIVPVPIRDGVAYFNGSRFTGEDYLPSLRQDTDWDF